MSGPGSAFERILVYSLLGFAFVALIFEPLFYLSHPKWTQAAPVAPWMTSLWEWGYIEPFDPIFNDPPNWLFVFCWIEVLVWGPLYLWSAWLIWNASQLQHLVLLPFAGALFYSTVVYFVLDLLDPVPGTHFVGVTLINLPWTLLPVALVWHVWKITGSNKRKRS